MNKVYNNSKNTFHFKGDVIIKPNQDCDVSNEVLSIIEKNYQKEFKILVRGILSPEDKPVKAKIEKSQSEQPAS